MFMRFCVACSCFGGDCINKGWIILPLAGCLLTGEYCKYLRGTVDMKITLTNGFTSLDWEKSWWVCGSDGDKGWVGKILEPLWVGRMDIWWKGEKVWHTDQEVKKMIFTTIETFSVSYFWNSFHFMSFILMREKDESGLERGKLSTQALFSLRLYQYW